MIRFWKKRLEWGTLTDTHFSKEMKQLRKELKTLVQKRFSGSLSIRLVDSGSCNGCEAECNALSNPYYNLGKLGIHFVASPRHADVLLVTGVVSFNMKSHLLDAYEQVPAPKWVVTVGDCATLDSPIEKTFAVVGPVENHLKVDYHIKGCPPSPEDIIRGLIAFLKGI